MPLSDAAKALLAARKNGAAPTAKAAKAKAEDPEDLDAAERERREGFRARAKREAERFELATDTEYWVVLCFRQPHHPAAFCDAAGVAPDEHGYLSGHALRTALGALPPRSARDRAKALMAARKLGDAASRMSSAPRPDPLAGLAYTGDLPADAALEFDALLAALTAPPDPSPVFLLDSPHWIAIHWPSRDDKETFLGDAGWDVLGDKYLDGHQAAKILNITMKE